MPKRRTSIFRTRNVQERRQERRDEKDKLRRDWLEALIEGDDDELRRLTAEHGFKLYRVDNLCQVFAEAEAEVIKEQDDEEAAYDAEDWKASGGVDWVKHVTKV